MNKAIIIEVERGIVTDVHNLPDGYTYEIKDHDVMGVHEHDWDRYGKCVSCKAWDVDGERLP